MPCFIELPSSTLLTPRSPSRTKFNVAYPQISVKDKLQCRENFDRIEPISPKCGVMLAKCPCNDSYQKFCCVESIVFSILYNSELVVPSTERDKQLKAKTKRIFNPFNAAAVRMKKAEKETTVVEQR